MLTILYNHTSNYLGLDAVSLRCSYKESPLLK